VGDGEGCFDSLEEGRYDWIRAGAVKRAVLTCFMAKDSRAAARFKFVMLLRGPTSSDLCATVDCQGFVNTATASPRSPDSRSAGWPSWRSTRHARGTHRRHSILLE
jgi:hypothetical protein